MDYECIEEDVEIIEWDYIEDRFIDDCGNLYKSIEDIPEKYQHLVQPIKPLKPLRVRVHDASHHKLRVPSRVKCKRV